VLLHGLLLLPPSQSVIHSFLTEQCRVNLGLFLIIVDLLASLKSALLQAEKLASTDHLTGLVNRRLFLNLAKTEINRFRRYKHPFTIAYIDIDNFKTVNDTLT